MERLWIREVRRAARHASAPFARQVALGCAAAAVGTIVASLLPLQSDGAVAQAVWAALWAVAGYAGIWIGLASGFRPYELPALGCALALIVSFVFTGVPVGLGATLIVAGLVLRRAGLWWRRKPAPSLMAAAGA